MQQLATPARQERLTIWRASGERDSSSTTAVYSAASRMRPTAVEAATSGSRRPPSAGPISTANEKVAMMSPKAAPRFLGCSRSAVNAKDSEIADTAPVKPYRRG